MITILESGKERGSKHRVHHNHGGWQHCVETCMKMGEGTEPTHHSRRMAARTTRNYQIKDTGRVWEEE